MRFDCHRDQVEPLFVQRAGEGVDRGEVVEGFGRFVGEDGLVVPETYSRVCGDGRQFKVVADLKQGDGQLGWDSLFPLLSALSILLMGPRPEG